MMPFSRLDYVLEYWLLSIPFDQQALDDSLEGFFHELSVHMEHTEDASLIPLVFDFLSYDCKCDKK